MERRQQTITDIAQAIFDAQPGFFEKGLKGLRPMTMQEIAEKAGVHHATVSRTVRDKYASTPKGTVELRKFFTSGITTDSGEQVTKDALRERLAAIIEGEDKAHPLSDDRLSEMGAPVLIETVKAVENNTLQPKKQDDSKSTYAKMITKDMSALDFNDTAEHIHNVIRGITGFTMLDGKRLKIYKSRLSGETNAEAGSVTDKDNFTVACGDGRTVTFLEVQYEGSKRMSTDSFLRGRKLTDGQKLG